MSPENQGIAEQAVLVPRKMFVDLESDKPPMLAGQSSLQWIKVLAQNEPDLVFTSLAHSVDFHLLN